MTPETKAKLTAAFEKVGPEFIERAMRVRKYGANPLSERDTACRCFVSMGQTQVENPSREDCIDAWKMAPKEYGASAITVLHRAYEYNTEVPNMATCTKEELFTLAEEWLEQNRTKVEVCTLTLQG